MTKVVFLFTAFNYTCTFVNYIIDHVQNAPPLAQAPVYSQGPSPAPPVIIASPNSFGRDSMTMRCPHCQQQIQTSIRSKPGAIGKAHTPSQLLT